MDAKKRSRMEEKANGSEGVNARKKGKPSSSITTAPWLSRNSKGFMCPYLDTINRKVLDFDFEKICSVSLNNFNVYACLVCGTYFQGRGKGTHAYLHSLEVDHHMFINLTTRNIYCLPDNYQVHEISLEDITYNLRPEFKKSDVRRFDKEGEYYHALDGTDYLIGFMGLNNIKNTDWFNVSAQALSHVPLLRNFFLFPENYESKVDDVEKKWVHQHQLSLQTLTLNPGTLSQSPCWSRSSASSCARYLGSEALFAALFSETSIVCTSGLEPQGL
eukprot:513998-Amorphochlora_amoeboformis.AAC.1